ncbi:MAG: Na+-transporting oxaloacetate decarboxylase subunit gamma [Sulfurovum sp.]|nr:Na+-transporting oxaloacetate decarboxylase subunit gamma [Sulfurovum sp.]
MEYSLVGEGLKFMVLGMLIVFAFLVVLVQVMKLQAKLINKFFPEQPAEAPKSSGTNAEQDKHHVAAIVAAVTDFRKQS